MKHVTSLITMVFVISITAMFMVSLGISKIIAWVPRLILALELGILIAIVTMFGISTLYQIYQKGLRPLSHYFFSYNDHDVINTKYTGASRSQGSHEWAHPHETLVNLHTALLSSKFH